MLRLFEVEVFKNFRDRITLDFSNVRDYRFNKECITPCRLRYNWIICCILAVFLFSFWIVFL